jgi:hypothetical protein
MQKPNNKSYVQMLSKSVCVNGLINTNDKVNSDIERVELQLKCWN